MSHSIGHNLAMHTAHLYSQYETANMAKESALVNKLNTLTQQLERVEKALAMITKDSKASDPKKDKVDYTDSPEAMDLFDSIRNAELVDLPDPRPLFEHGAYRWEGRQLENLKANLNSYIKQLTASAQQIMMYVNKVGHERRDALDIAVKALEAQMKAIDRMLSRIGRRG